MKNRTLLIAIYNLRDEVWWKTNQLVDQSGTIPMKLTMVGLSPSQEIIEDVWANTRAYRDYVQELRSRYAAENQ